VFNPPVIHERLGDRIANTVFGGFRRWDGVYFLHIAEHGYSYENTLAFFPLYPFVVRLVANTLLYPLFYCLSYSNVLLIAAVLVNFVCFVASAVVLFELGKLVLDNERLAYRASQLYCVNPASIFFSAAYSESSYALLSWLGMLAVERNRLNLASIYFGLSGAARSNGLVNVGFIFHRTLRNVVEILIMREVAAGAKLRKIVSIMLLTVLRLVVVFVPFSAYQYYSYTVFCNPLASYRDLPTEVRRYGSERGYKMPYSGLSVWCSYTLPVSYSYVQSNHWDVGFLRYYEVKQIPNFVLAVPMVCLASYAIWLVLSKHPTHCLWLGLKKVTDVDARHKKNEDVKADDPSTERCLPAGCFVYIAHIGFLLTFGVLFMHVQVSV
jgi:phosphatidylinositol glycan class V